ncbi:hypothetical protein AHF37_09018 [Paragonimus kellicotti]|nr:hypothetical protein AHF37_09018 [Paragonimus kellicotti]
MTASGQDSFERMTDIEHEEDYTGDLSGCGSIGLRASKFTPKEWHEYHDCQKNRTACEQASSEYLKLDSKQLIRSTEAITAKYQLDSTKRLKERLHDISFWKLELEKEIQDTITETFALIREKRRLENALAETEYPLQIVKENLNSRGRRRGIDNVEDKVEAALILEANIIHDVQDVLKKTIEQSERQIKQNRDVKEAMEVNWSEKIEAEECDSIASKLHNGSTNKQFYSGVARFQDNMSTPQSWAVSTHEIIIQSENQRTASAELRSLISKLLTDTSRDMREQFDRVCKEFRNNSDRLVAAKIHLENQLKKTVNEIAIQEKNNEDLREAIRAKDDPLKVAQTRLHVRQLRPNMELCKDPAQESLVTEVDILTRSLDSLLQEAKKAEHKLKDLQDNQMNLEKEMELKEESIRIDEVQCMPRRSMYPSTLKLQGYP